MNLINGDKNPKILEQVIDIEETIPWLTSLAILKTLLLLPLCFFAFELISKPQPYILLDYANFFIHETGHFVFYSFGEFMNILGGSLFQLLVPLFVTLYFVIRKQWFSSFFGLFWLGNNFMNVSFYIGDARARVLPLANFVGIYQESKEGHDWYRLLSQLNILHLDTTIAHVVYIIGAIVIVLAIILCLSNIGWDLYKIYRIKNIQRKLSISK